ncbi:hypothetical protein PHAVU_001G053800, partial [Phaseolus vulgaris]
MEVSFFFSNFPMDLDERDMWKVFHRQSKLKDRFSFVRFQEELDVDALERRLSLIWIEAWKLRHKETRKERNESHRTMQLKYEWRQKDHRLTYAQAVGKENQKRTQGVVVQSGIHTRVKEDCVRQSFLMEGYNFNRMRYLGGLYVLLSGESDEALQKSIEDNKETFAEFFDSVVPWDNSFVVEDKVVWVRCRGIPLKFWNKNCFKQVATLVGALIEVDVATLQQKVLEFARLKVRVPCRERFPKLVEQDDCMNKGGEDNFYENGMLEKKKGNVANKCATASEECDLITNGPVAQRREGYEFSVFMDQDPEDVENEQVGGATSKCFSEVQCNAINDDWEWWHDIPGEQFSGMQSHGKVRLLSVIEIHEDEGSATGS